MAATPPKPLSFGLPEPHPTAYAKVIYPDLMELTTHCPLTDVHAPMEEDVQIQENTICVYIDVYIYINLYIYIYR